MFEWILVEKKKLILPVRFIYNIYIYIYIYIFFFFFFFFWGGGGVLDRKKVFLTVKFHSVRGTVVDRIDLTWASFTVYEKHLWTRRTFLLAVKISKYLRGWGRGQDTSGQEAVEFQSSWEIHVDMRKLMLAVLKVFGEHMWTGLN